MQFCNVPNVQVSDRDMGYVMSKSTAFNPFQVLEKSVEGIPEDLASGCRKIFKRELSTKLNGFKDVQDWIHKNDKIAIFKADFVPFSLWLVLIS